MNKYIRTATAGLVVSALTLGSAVAQNTPAITADAALQQQQADLDARLKIMQDQQALVTASIPSSTTQPNSGAYTVSGSSPFPSQRLAYRDLMILAGKIAGDVKPEIPAAAKTVFIYDPNQVAAVMNVISIDTALTVLNTQVTSLNDYFDANFKQQIATLEAPPHVTHHVESKFIPPPLAIMAGLKASSDLLGMFRSNTSINYSSFSADNVALTAGVANQLVADGCSVYEPALMPLNLGNDGSALLDKLSAVYARVSHLQFEVSDGQAQLQLASTALGSWITAAVAAQANRDLIASETDPAKLAALKKVQPGLDGAADAARRYVTSILKWSSDTTLDMATASSLKGERDRTISGLTTIGGAITGVATSVGAAQSALLSISNTGGAASATLLSAERLLEKARAQGGGVFLSLNDAVLGGSVVTRVNLFTGGHLVYTGGAIASYALFGLDGKVLATGVETGAGGAEKADF
jgi:hypothetical protein